MSISFAFESDSATVTKALFCRFKVSDVLHTVRWENDADLAPEDLHRKMVEQCDEKLAHAGGKTNQSAAIADPKELIHHGMIYVGLPDTCPELTDISEAKGGSPCGAATIAALDGSRQPSEKELAQARFQGRHVTQIAAKLLSGLSAHKDRLTALGYDPHHCLTDFGETAEAVVRAALEAMSFDCVLVGTGVRTVPSNFLLFERLLNVVHRYAPQARLCFNTKPTDTADAVQRWV